MSSRYVGGQAVIEGVMMRGATSWAVAVRRPDGEIEIESGEAPAWAQRYRRYPIVRGVAALGESMSLGVRALTWSASRHAGAGDVPPLTRGQVTATVAFALGMFTALFVLLPALVTKAAAGGLGDLGFNAFEGGFKLALFLGYIALIGRIGDIRRVFQYHGAEHKAIAAYESEGPVTPERADAFTTRHVRCGTNFLLLVIVLSILSHALFGRPGWLLLAASRILVIPVIAGIAYELVRFAADRMDNPVVRFFMAPGLLLQRMTTREPTLDQIEVAITSLRAVLTAEQLAEVDARPVAPAAAAAVALAPAPA